MDARYFQITFLGALLTAGVVLRDFSLRWEQAALTFAAGLAVQAFFMRRLRLNAGYLSAIISCFSVSIILRSDNLWAHPVAAAIGVGAKFLVRAQGKHLYNPGNLAVIAGLSLLPGTWVSAGQWGHDVAFAAWFVALGATVSRRAFRDDISWAFLASWFGLVGLRVLWLGQRAAVWQHQLQNGAILLFAFFMISDPMTVPNRRSARFLYAFLVAVLSYVWQYGYFKTNALLWSLFFLSPLVPLLDRLLPAPIFSWKKVPYETNHAAAGGRLRPRPAH